LPYYVYIVQCSDNTLYTGITKDIDRRTKEHNTSSRGAKYTRSRRPVILVYSKAAGTRSDALREEYRIKKLSRIQKLRLIGK
jgi:putative endonuclease